MNWIKCSERLPEGNERVLVWMKYLDEMRIAYQDFDDEWIIEGLHSPYYKSRDMTHWMPLPTPPSTDAAAVLKSE